MPRTRTLIGALLCSAMIPSAQGCEPSMYYLEGIDRGDGMSTSIDLHSGHVRVTSTQFDATTCSSGTLCFTSGYMTFASPPADGTPAWTAEGRQFTSAGQCTVAKAGASIEVRKIASSQEFGTFSFYFDPTRDALVGWTLRHADVEGDTAVDTWMASGWTACP